MSKKLIIKLIIVLVVAALVYSLFWFFKVSQIEKQISKFANQNSAYVSVGEISASGFPLNQNITIKNLKFSIPNAAFGGNQIIVKHLEAKAGIFDANFTINLERDVLLQTLEGKESIVEFETKPTMTALIEDGLISNISYEDSGYKIYDNERALMYSATQSSFSVKILNVFNEEIITKINASVQGVEGFDVIDIYKNAFEKDIIDGIKTGEIVLGNLPMDMTLNNAVVATENPDDLATEVVTDKVVKAELEVENQNASKVVAADVKSETNGKIAAAMDIDPTLITADDKIEEVLNEAALPEDLLGDLDNAKIVEKVAEIKPVKNNFVVNIEYILTPNKTSQEIDIPFDPTQIQDIPVQYSKSIKINTLVNTNVNYEISIDGGINSLPDDGLPSGSLNLTIKHMDMLTNYLSQSFADIAAGKDIGADEVQAVDLMENELEEDNSYNDFLIKLSVSMKAVAKELSEKSELTKDEMAHFTIKREKNLDFLVNESSIREILGKF